MTTERLAGAMRRRGLGWWPALWLILSLLLAQHAGIVHRVVHGGLLQAPIAPLESTAPVATATAGGAPDTTHSHRADSLKPSGHSCVLFDTATAADTLCDGPAMPRLAHGKPVLPPGITWRWPHLPAARPFLSRAPPSPFAFA